MSYELIKKEDKKWFFKNNETYSRTMSFDFSHLPNNWFVDTHKQFITDSLKLGTPKIQTLHRYHYSLKHFYKFLDINEININYFSELFYDDIQLFINYLSYTNLSRSVRNNILSALKKIIEHGILFEYEGFPTKQIFDGKEYALIGSDNNLKTSIIRDDVMKLIENSLKKEKNLIIKSLIEILIDTGARISEILDLTSDSLVEDFTGKPILKIYSSKNESERFIPISRRVYWAVKNVTKSTKDMRKELGTSYIFLYKKNKKKTMRVHQSKARYELDKFLRNNKIKQMLKSDEIVTFHSFRHTLGTQMLNDGMSIFEIQDYLGHDSTHSTSLYAKIKNPKIQSEYKRAGFIGLIKKSKKDIEDIKQNNGSTTDIKSAALPDGVCGQPIDNQGNICAKFNACVICPKFITTPEHLPIHKNHLERLRQDKEEYMKTEYIGTQEHLEKVEFALVTIIERLEDIRDGSKEAN